MRYLHLNKILKISIFLLSTLILIYFVFTCNYKDKFSVSEMKINFINSNERIGVFINLNKKYVSSSNSQRLFFCGSREKGLFGLENTDLNIVIVDDENNDYTKYFNVKNNFLNQKEKLSLIEFLTDLKNNKDYLSGQKIANENLYFWLDEYSEINNLELKIKVKNNSKNFVIRLDEE